LYLASGCNIPARRLIGGGAQSVCDGLDCYGAQTMQGTRMPDVEVFEAQEPMLVL